MMKKTISHSTTQNLTRRKFLALALLGASVIFWNPDATQIQKTSKRWLLKSGDA